MQRIEPQTKHLGEFSVRRFLPGNTQPGQVQHSVGPWVFFDHMGPAAFPAGSGVDVRPHPHIHLATVTYLFEGEILHRDSLGNEVAITAGAVNLMVAGRGITHSERERAQVREQPHHTEGLQLWLALPEDQQACDPAFYHIPASDIMTLSKNGVHIRVLMGDAYNTPSPVPCVSPTLYVEIRLQAGANVALPTLPVGYELAVYVVRGCIRVGDESLAMHEMLAFNAHELHQQPVYAEDDAHIILIGGEPLGKRFIDWNFVSTSQAAIEKAKADWKAGLFPKVVGDAEDYIPLI